MLSMCDLGLAPAAPRSAQAIQSVAVNAATAANAASVAAVGMLSPTCPRNVWSACFHRSPQKYPTTPRLSPQLRLCCCPPPIPAPSACLTCCKASFVRTFKNSGGPARPSCSHNCSASCFTAGLQNAATNLMACSCCRCAWQAGGVQITTCFGRSTSVRAAWYLTGNREQGQPTGVQ